jgi:hypothetical protein
VIGAAQSSWNVFGMNNRFHTLLMRKRIDITAKVQIHGAVSTATFSTSCRSVYMLPPWHTLPQSLPKVNSSLQAHLQSCFDTAQGTVKWSIECFTTTVENFAF